MLNILIKLRLNRRSLQIIDLQVSMAQLPGRTNVRPPWALAHGNQNISCFDSGIVSNIKLKGFVAHPRQLLRELITKQHSCLCPGGQRLKLDKFTYGAIIELWKSWQTTTGHVSHGTWIHLTSIKGAACQRRRLTFYTSGSAFALSACLLQIQQNTENRPLGPGVQGGGFRFVFYR